MQLKTTICTHVGGVVLDDSGPLTKIRHVQNHRPAHTDQTESLEIPKESYKVRGFPVLVFKSRSQLKTRDLYTEEVAAETKKSIFDGTQWSEFQSVLNYCCHVEIYFVVYSGNFINTKSPSPLALLFGIFVSAWFLVNISHCMNILCKSAVPIRRWRIADVHRAAASDGANTWAWITHQMLCTFRSGMSVGTTALHRRRDEERRFERELS